MNIYQKLIEVRKEVPYLRKENKSYEYMYTGSSQVLGSLKKKMDELGLLLVPKIISQKITHEVYEKDNKRKTEKFTELEILYTWINAENPEERIECPWFGQGVDTSEKGIGKALTYAEKYFMLKFFNIATDKDDPDTWNSKYNEPDEAAPDKQPGNTKPDKKLDDKKQQVTDQLKPDKPEPLLTGAQRAELYRAGHGDEKLCRKVVSRFGYASSTAIPQSHFSEVLKAIQEEHEKISNNSTK